jgi:hypothetical protein
MILRLRNFFSYIPERTANPARRSYARLLCPTRVSMKPSSLSAAIFIISLAALYPLRSSHALDQTPQKIVEYNERVAMSTGEVRKGDVCADFYPDLESDEFFKGLQRIESDNGREYRKYSRVVTAYPPHLTLQIDIRISVCDADVYTPAPTPEFLKTLHFKVQWKREMYLRPVTNYSVENVPLNLGESENRKLLVIQIHDSENVPITDHLILTILSPDGKILSRMAARI